MGNAGLRSSTVGGLDLRVQGLITPWFLVGYGGMDPCDSPLRSPILVPETPFPHSQLRTREITASGIRLQVSGRYGFPGLRLEAPVGFDMAVLKT